MWRVRLKSIVFSQIAAASTFFTNNPDEPKDMIKERPRFEKHQLFQSEFWKVHAAEAPKQEQNISSLLRICDAERVQSWETALSQKRIETAFKVNEGSFGEVYAIRSTEKPDQYNILKIVPIDGELEVNGFEQLTSSEITPELVCSIALTNLWNEGQANRTKCFIHLKKAYLVKGAYHPHLLKEWYKYDKKEDSNCGDPMQFPDDQIYLLFEYEYGGESLDNFQLTSTLQLLSIILQVGTALAAAERGLQFEHRDLHLGNVLVFLKEQPKIHKVVVDDKSIEFNDAGVSVRLIDFTLARFDYKSQHFHYAFEDNDMIFEGDNSEPHHQIYRGMRACTRENWKGFYPVTNLLWIEYLLWYCLAAEKDKDSKVYNLLDNLLKRVRKCWSSIEFINSPEFLETIKYLNKH